MPIIQVFSFFLTLGYWQLAEVPIARLFEFL
jgi:hypothetical protein